MLTKRCLVRGSINIDEFYQVKAIVQPGETISSTSLERRAGGKGANQAVAVARAGGSATIMGVVGEDGEWVVQKLKGFGVDTSRTTSAKVPTGRAIIQLTQEGQNSIILFPGANHVRRPLVDDLLRLHTHLLLQNEISFEDTLTYLSVCATYDISSIYNPSPLPSTEQLCKIAWSKVRWLVINEVEALQLLSSMQGATAGADDMDIPCAWSISNPVLKPYFHTLFRLSRLSLFNAINIVCTIGPHGVVAFIPELSASTSADEPIYLPAAILRGEVRDTTGAGDCFTGYLAAGLLESDDRDRMRKEDYIAILQRCVHAAGICVERRGAMDSIPTRDEVESRVRDS